MSQVQILTAKHIGSFHIFRSRPGEGPYARDTPSPASSPLAAPPPKRSPSPDEPAKRLKVTPATETGPDAENDQYFDQMGQWGDKSGSTGAVPDSPAGSTDGSGSGSSSSSGSDSGSSGSESDNEDNGNDDE